MFCQCEVCDNDFHIQMQGSVCKKCLKERAQEVIEKMQEATKELLACNYAWQRECEKLKKRNSPSVGIRNISLDIHENAKAHGWWEHPTDYGTQIALFHSELSEALECMRRGEHAEYFQMKDMDCLCSDMKQYDGGKVYGWATELIDCVIRIFDFLVAKDIDIEGVLMRKHEYNKTRPWKHNKVF